MASDRRDNDSAPTPCQYSRIGIALVATYRVLLSSAVYPPFFLKVVAKDSAAIQDYQSPKNIGENSQFNSFMAKHGCLPCLSTLQIVSQSSFSVQLLKIAKNFLGSLEYLFYEKSQNLRAGSLPRIP